MQGGDEGPAFAIPAVGEHHTEAEAVRHEFLDDRDRQWWLRLVHVTRLETGLRFEEAEEQREGRRLEHTVGIHRDDTIGQRVQIADVLGRDVVGGVPLFAIPSLIEAQDQRRLAQRLAQQLQPRAAQRLHRPVGMGQEMVEGLRVDRHRLPQAWQGLTTGLRQQPQVQGGELLEVPHVVEQAALRGALVVAVGHRRGGGAHAGQGNTSLCRTDSADGVPHMADEGLSAFGSDV